MLDSVSSAPDAVTRDYDLLRSSSAIYELEPYAFVRLTGEDRKGWLQGQVTNDLRNFEPGASKQFCVCEPTGQILAPIDCWSTPDSLALAMPTQILEAFMRRVDQMVILEDVEAKVVTGEYRFVTVQGPEATKRLQTILSLPQLDHGVAQIGETPVLCFRANRTGMGGWDLWLPKRAVKANRVLRESFAAAGPEAVEIARLEAGIPRWGADISGKVLPPELGPAFEARNVDYRKGCYTGQEVLQRIHSRGHTNRTWVGLTAESGLTVGATVSQGRLSGLGTVTSAAWSPDFGHIAAAFVRNEIASDRELVQVHTDAGPVDAEVRHMPLLRMY
jgi:folate-binding protein YgfZ